MPKKTSPELIEHVKITTTLSSTSKQVLDKFSVQYSDILRLGFSKFKEIVKELESAIAKKEPLVFNGFSGDGLSGILSRLLAYYSNGAISNVVMDASGNIIRADFKDDFSKEGDELRLMKSGAKFSTLLSVLSRPKFLKVDKEINEADVESNELQDVNVEGKDDHDQKGEE